MSFVIDRLVDGVWMFFSYIFAISMIALAAFVVLVIPLNIIFLIKKPSERLYLTLKKHKVKLITFVVTLVLLIATCLIYWFNQKESSLYAIIINSAWGLASTAFVSFIASAFIYLILNTLKKTFWRIMEGHFVLKENQNREELSGVVFFVVAIMIGMCIIPGYIMPNS